MQHQNLPHIPEIRINAPYIRKITPAEQLAACLAILEQAIKKHKIPHHHIKIEKFDPLVIITRKNSESTQAYIDITSESDTPQSGIDILLKCTVIPKDTKEAPKLLQVESILTRDSLNPLEGNFYHRLQVNYNQKPLKLNPNKPYLDEHHDSYHKRAHKIIKTLEKLNVVLKMEKELTVYKLVPKKEVIKEQKSDAEVTLSSSSSSLFSPKKEDVSRDNSVDKVKEGLSRDDSVDKVSEELSQFRL
jgi:hypothetical protein